MTGRRESGAHDHHPHTHRLDGAALRRAFSDRDAAALPSLYAEDATIEIVDAQTTPSRPLRVEGREADPRHFEDVFAREMTHEVETVAIGGDARGYSVRCAYPDGTPRGLRRHRAGARRRDRAPAHRAGLGQRGLVVALRLLDERRVERMAHVEGLAQDPELQVPRRPRPQGARAAAGRTRRRRR